MVDFGGQFAHLIASRVRALGAFSEIWSNTTPVENFQSSEIAGVIFSGGPASVFESGAPTIAKEILDLQIPILAICFGHQLVAHLLGGKVSRAKTQEFGKAIFHNERPVGIFENFPKNSVTWMSHGDSVQSLPPGFQLVGHSENGEIAAMANLQKKIFTVQFHPEVSHTESGNQLLGNFLEFCNVKDSWRLQDFVAAKCEEIRQQVGNRNVFLMVSGGVDSTVCFALLQKALGPKRVFGLLVDHGLLREREAGQVQAALKNAGFANLHVENASELFLKNLRGVSDPERKRQIIGNTFLQVQAQVAQRLGLDGDNWLLGQGTIFPDTIETGGTANSAKIKTHHNRVEQIEKLLAQGLVVEPVKELFKNEVRAVGLQLGLGEDLIWRRPFPGPGLGVRILCQDTRQVAQENALPAKSSEFPVAEFSLQLPLRSVGVQGDSRSFAHPLCLFGRDLAWPDLQQWATQIPNNFRQINRVTLCLSHSSRPENAQSFPAEISKDRAGVLQKADALVLRIFKKMAPKELQKQVWQFPVCLAPMNFAASESDRSETLILRPVESENAMTASVGEFPPELLQEITQAVLQQIPEISVVLLDLTSKPPGTIEWE